MTTHPRTAAEPSDPVDAALADDEVRRRLTAAARAFLSRRARQTTATQIDHDVEDVLHNVCVEVLKKKHEYDPSRDVTAWIIGFVLNVTRDHVRKKARDPAPACEPCRLDSLAADLGRKSTDAADDRDQAAAILARLPEADRTLLEMRYTEALTFAEIAKRLGCEENAARVRHHRIVSRLRESGGAPGEVRS